MEISWLNGVINRIFVNNDIINFCKRELLVVVNSNRYRIDFFVLLFFTFAAAIIGDNATEALILSQNSSDLVSRMFSVNATILFLFSFFSMSLVDRFNRGKLFQLFVVLYGIVIFGSWLLASAGVSWVFIPLYTIGYSGKIFSFFFVWTMANDVSDARKGLRDFPIIAAGGTLGAIITTFAIPSIVSRISTGQLLFLWLIPLVIVFILTHRVRKRYDTFFRRKDAGRRKITVTPKALVGNLKTVFQEPLLRGMAIAYFLIFFLVFNQQYLFYTVVKEKLVESVQISRFLGYFTGISLTATFLLQIGIAGPITRKLGVIRTLYLLPIALTIAFVLLLAGYNSTGVLLFNAVIAGLALRIAFFDSFFSPSYQNFFSSLPAHLRGNSKLAIDGVIKPVAMISTTIWIHFVDPGKFSFTVLVIVSIGALASIIRLKKRYIATLVKYLTGYRNNSALSISQEAQLFNSKEGLSELRSVLNDNIYEVQRFAIDLLVEIDSEKSIEVLTSLFYKRSGEVQAYVTTALVKSERPEVIQFLYDVLSLTPYPRVVANTIWTLGEMKEAETSKLVQFVKSETPRIRGNCIVILSRSGGLTEEEQEIQLRAMLYHSSEDIQATGLWVASQIPMSVELQNDLYSFWIDGSQRIVQNIYLWRQYLNVVVALGNHFLLSQMVRFYSQLDELKQQVVQFGLIKYGKVNGIEALVQLENDAEGLSQAIVLDAICDSEERLSSEQAERVTQFAEKEFKLAIEARNIYGFLTKEYPEHILFGEVIFEHELELHLKNLFTCALILDRSGKLRSLKDQYMLEDGSLNPKVIEILDTIRSNRVNRQLVSYAEKKHEKRINIRGLIHHLQSSRSRLVRDFTAYFSLEMSNNG